ncbi:MAG: hypothetical protein ACFCUT_17100 [Kiloniellaceae bacterium]
MVTTGAQQRGSARGKARLLAALGLSGALALAAGAAAAAGAGYTVEVAEFVVSVGDGEGNDRTVISDLVPYLPNRACFGWRIRLTEAPPLVRVREVLKLPQPPLFWSGEDDEYSPHVFSADRTTATTEEFAAPEDGWLESSWCIVEGDPTGPHSIDVFIEDELVRHFDFEVKKLREPTNN